jgi:hypothetical protein
VLLVVILGVGVGAMPSPFFLGSFFLGLGFASLVSWGCSMFGMIRGTVATTGQRAEPPRIHALQRGRASRPSLKEEVGELHGSRVQGVLSPSLPRESEVPEWIGVSLHTPEFRPSMTLRASPTRGRCKRACP